MTTKANGNDIDVFAVRSGGRLSASPVVNSEPGTVPFAITFDRAGHVVIAEAGTNALATFGLGQDGTITLLGSTTTDPGTVDATASAGGRFLYVQTGLNGIVDEFAVGSGGSLTQIGSVTVPGAVGGEGIAAG